MAITAGLYELRSVLQTSMLVAGAGYEPVAGANVMLYSNNDGNNRKWRLASTSSGWRLQNAATGLYMTLGASVPANGVNVRQWTASTNAIQYWNVIETGETVTLDGYTCPVVMLGNYVTSDGTTWVLDIDSAMTSNNTNVQIWRNTAAYNNRKFALYPVTLLDNSFPVPASLGWVTDTAQVPYTTTAGNTRTAMNLGWRCPSNWVPNSSRGFERRIRVRYMSASTSAWGAWSAWSQWQAVNHYMRGSYCYDLNTVDGSFDKTTYKAKEVQFEVRAKNSTAHGNSASTICRAIVDPSATFTSGGATEAGFQINVASDYTPAYYTVRSLVLDGAELLSTPIDIAMLTSSGSFTIPWDSLSSLGGLPEQGASATAKYSRGTDLFPNINGGATRSASLTITYGTPTSVAPTFSEAAGRSLDATHPSGIAGVWVSHGGKVYYDGDGSGIVYPFGADARALIVLRDGKVWNGPLPYPSKKPCHAWNWDGGSFLLEVLDGFMETSRSIKANATTLQLNNREWESLVFSDTLSGEFTAEGVLKAGLTESTKADLMALMKAHHVVYRAPTGEMANVGITDVQYTERNGFVRVKVGMEQVTP